MKAIFPVLIAAAALAGCSERDMCLSNTGQNLRVLEDLARTTAANLERGYAIGEREILRERRDFCDVTQPDGSVLRQICTRTEPVTETFPVAIDLNAERAKLQSLRTRIAAERERTAAARAQCIATYPE